MKRERFKVRLPSGQWATAEVRLDLERLVQDLAWKAYYSPRKRSTLKNGAVIVELKDDGAAPEASP